MKLQLNKLIPFIFLGIAIVALVAGIILLSYLLLFGAVVGLGLFVIAKIKENFFPTKVHPIVKKHPSTGRTIDQDDHVKK